MKTIREHNEELETTEVTPMFYLKWHFLRALVLAIAMMLSATQPAIGQTCVECAAGCSETTVSLVYGNLFCSCPTSSRCVSSGGICTDCNYAGPAYCWDTYNGCGGWFDSNANFNCGCNDPCQA